MADAPIWRTALIEDSSVEVHEMARAFFHETRFKSLEFNLQTSSVSFQCS